MVGLCLVAVLAVTAIAASSASALPEWGRCKEQAGGKYTDSNCTIKAKKGAGTYEWVKGTAGVTDKTFLGEGGTGILQADFTECEPGLHTRKACKEGETEAHAEVPVECSSEIAHGEVTGSKELGNISVTFFGCAAEGGALPCANGTNPGEIAVNPLKGKLGYISKAGKEVGVLLQPAKKGEFAKFSCVGVLTIGVGVGSKSEGYAYPETKGGNDGIISPIAPVNAMTNTYTQTYTFNEKLENVPQFEKGKEYKLETYLFLTGEPEKGSAWSPAGEEITNVNKAKETTEIKA